MENYDLLALYNYQNRPVGCSDCEEQTVEIEEPELQQDGENLVNNEEQDTLTIDGEDVGGFGKELTDEEVEEGLKNQNTGKISDFGIYKQFAETILDTLKFLILWALKGTKPDITPGGNNPGGVTPGGDNPGGVTPGGDTPGGDTPGGVTPGGDNPGGETPPPSELPGDGSDGSGPANPFTPENDNEVVTLSRGHANYQSVKVEAGKERILRLTNPLTGSNYEYKISSTNGQTIQPQFKFLANGRLVVKGDNIKLVANSNQKDDIILLGNNCYIDTGDGDDIVRDAYVKDSDNLYKLDSSQDPYTDYYIGSAHASYSNIIKTGTGNDYVVSFGTNYQIDMGDGYDKVQILGATADVTHADLVYEMPDVTSNFDHIDGWTLQGSIGDCRLFALINSICKNNNVGSLSEYVEIKKSGNNYTVRFKNYPDQSEATATITQAEINNYININNVKASGDLDTILVDIAMNKLIKENTDNPSFDRTSVDSAYYNTIAKYLFGNELMTFFNTTTPNFRSRLEELWEKYDDSGQISNLTIGIHDKDPNSQSTGEPANGVVFGHAYSIRKYDMANNYIELVNPWDDADCLRLDLDKFYSYYIEVQVYGSNEFSDLPNKYIPNGDKQIPGNPSY